MTAVIRIGTDIEIGEDALEFQAVRAQGAGGQHVNKTSSAVVLRFDIANSTLPAAIRERLLNSNDRRISSDGVVVIKAQNARSQQANRRDAINRLAELIADAATVAPPRIKTRPRAGSVRRRLDSKKQRGDTKRLRSRPRQRDDE